MMSNFTNSSLATMRRIRNSNRNTPRNQAIGKITIHHVAGVMTSQNLLNWGHDPRCGGSWQYGIGNDGDIHQLIDERDRAWTSSSAWNDNRAVTLEVSNSTGAPNWEIGQRAWDAMIDLCVDIVRRNPGITRRDGRSGLWFDGTQNGSLTFHDMFTATVCPGPFIRSRAQQICDDVNAQLDKLLSATQSRNGWVQTNGNWSFYANDQRQQGWLQHENQWYLINNQGVMRDGWVRSRGHWYFLNPRAGQLGRTNRLPHGAMRDGWVELEADEWYFLNPESGQANHDSDLPHGAMWYADGKIDGVNHRFNSSGRWLGEK